MDKIHETAGDGAVPARHVGLRVHRLVDHGLEQGPGRLPHVEGPVAMGRELP